MYIFHIPIFIIIMLFFVSILKAEDDASFTQINLRLAKDFGTSNKNLNADGVDTSGSYIEIETIASKNNFELYGFSDIRLFSSDSTGNEDRAYNFDFYKYNIGYDIFGNDLLFLKAEVKETYSDGKGDSFEGIGTRIPVPLVGNIDVTLYYYNGANSSSFEVENPYSLQFSWFNILYHIDNNWSIAHGGWADYDFFSKHNATSSTEEDHSANLQIYESVSFNYKNSYAVELGYKYWHNTFGLTGSNSHTGYVNLVKRF